MARGEIYSPDGDGMKALTLALIEQIRLPEEQNAALQAQIERAGIATTA